MTEQRDGAKDLEVCSRATPGPWFKDGPRRLGGYDVLDGDGKEVIAGNGFGPFREGDADFTTLAREALPHWITRALAAESKVQSLEGERDRLFAGVKEIDGGTVCEKSNNWCKTCMERVPCRRDFVRYILAGGSVENWNPMAERERQEQSRKALNPLQEAGESKPLPGERKDG